MIKLLVCTITEMINPENSKKTFELASWNYSTELPYIALRSHEGFFDNYEQAESEKMKQEVIDKFQDKK